MKEKIIRGDIQKILAHMREHVEGMGTSDQASGMQIAMLIRILANLYENHRLSQPEDELSGARIGVLARLFDEERRGNHKGLTPTEISQNQHVSRNTISALLRGLESQGLIERKLDDEDLRLFHIRLSDAGVAVVREIVPQRIAITNALASGLTQEEQQQLIALLGKLFVSLQANYQCPAEHQKIDE